MSEHFDCKRGHVFPAMGNRLVHFYQNFPTTAFFEYHCWENDLSTDLKLWQHTQQKVKVLRRLPPRESDYEMYEVEFADGLRWVVFADELMNTPKKYERKPYPVAS